MKFRVKLSSISESLVIPVNYQYPLSAALYRIIAKGDEEYGFFLHEKGYGKGFKLFSFSQLKVPFKIQGDRLQLLSNEVEFMVSFHIPEAMENFVKGLFQSETIDIADKKSKVRFKVKSVESVPNSLQTFKDREIISLQLNLLSPVVAGIPNEKGNYDFLSPDDPRFSESLIFNWRSKIAACYDKTLAETAILLVEVLRTKYPFKSRLITIKADKEEETKIRGWMNFRLKVTGERRFVELLVNAGVGVYNSMGCGCMAEATKKTSI